MNLNKSTSESITTSSGKRVPVIAVKEMLIKDEERNTETISKVKVIDVNKMGLYLDVNMLERLKMIEENFPNAKTVTCKPKFRTKSNNI